MNNATGIEARNQTKKATTIVLNTIYVLNPNDPLIINFR